MFRFLKTILILFSIGSLSFVNAQTTTPAVTKPTTEKKWFENISIRGYMQVRYNRLLETNENLGCEQCDRSWGKNGGFFIRRMRVIIFGQISKNVYMYVQPDFASSPSNDRLHFGQLRDAYVDVGFDNKNEYRVRIGQSKIPYGFENMQSSQNRLPLDRNDALNSAIPNERDLGVFFYYAPAKKRELFADLVRSGLKGSGDYGVFAFGAYNGQGANNPEANNTLHTVARFSYPFNINKQIVEFSLQAYKGKFVIPRGNLTAGTKFKSDLSYNDNRVATSAILYAKPFGINAEYNVGTGPQFNKVTDSVEQTNLRGGYILFNYQTKYKQHTFIPFVRYQYYNGGKKLERDARAYLVREWELGVEWQPYRQFELVAMYTISNRRYEDFLLQNNVQKGSLLRLQAQLNF
jgi:hypothetical protein